MGSAASFALDWACAWREAGKAEVRTRTVASVHRLGVVALARLDDADQTTGSGTHRLVPLAQAEVIARQFPDLPRRQGRLAVFVFERVVHVRGGERAGVWSRRDLRGRI